MVEQLGGGVRSAGLRPNRTCVHGPPPEGHLAAVGAREMRVFHSVGWGWFFSSLPNTAGREFAQISTSDGAEMARLDAWR